MQNFGKRCTRGVSIDQKLALMKRSVRPLLTFRSSIWPPQKSLANEVDGLQRKMVSLVCPIRRHRDEPFDQYARRRGYHARKLIEQSESWSKHWFDRSIKFHEHVERGRSSCTWNQDLLDFHGSDWLQRRRAEFASVFSSRPNAWSIWAGRTGTRAAAGKVQPRWQEAIRWAASSRH